MRQNNEKQKDFSVFPLYERFFSPALNVCMFMFISSCSKEDDVHEGYAIQRLTVAAYKGKFAAGDKKASKDGLRYVFLLGDGDFAYGPASIPGLDEVYQEGKTYEVELRENF